MEVKVKKLHPDAVMPKYATEGAACFDLVAIDHPESNEKRGNWLSSSFYEGAETFRTGLAFEVPQGYVMLVYSRSGHGFKDGVRLSNCVGVIDSDYRGEVMVKLQKDGNNRFEVNKGDRIAQAMLVQVPQVQLVEVSELSDTERGAGGFGSTGSK